MKRLVAFAVVVFTSAASAQVTKQGVSDFGQTPFYAQGTFNTAHQDARNSDFHPWVLPSRYRIKWNALNRTGPSIPGSATYFGPSQSPIDGGLFQTEARGTGFSHLHKIDPETGETLAAVPPWNGACLQIVNCIGRDPSTPDFGVAAQAPLVDVDGNVYVADVDQYWSFDNDLSQRWVRTFAGIFQENRIRFGGTAQPANISSFLSSILTNDGLVGGITSDCHLILLNRDNGSLALEILEMSCGPTGSSPLLGILNFVFYVDGEVYFPLRQRILGGLFGVGPPNTNTPAVSPVSNRIYFVTSLTDATNCADSTDPPANPIRTNPLNLPAPCGSVIGIDLVPDGTGGRRAQVLFETIIGPASGASIAISPDSSSVYTIDGQNVLYGVDADDGSLIFTTPGAQGAASPTVGPDGNLFVAGNTELNSFDPDGNQRWSDAARIDQYQDLTNELLPTLRDFPPGTSNLPEVPDAGCFDEIVPLVDGRPTYGIIDVVSRSLEKVWTNVTFGYNWRAFVPIQCAFNLPPEPFIIEQKNALVAVNPDTGFLIDGAFTEYDGGNEGLTELSPDGSIYISKADILISPFYFVFNKLVPRRFRITEPPRGGITAFEPVSFCELSQEGIDAIGNLNARAKDQLPGGDLQDAFTQVRRAREQLRFTAQSVLDAAERNEIPWFKAARANQILRRAADGPMSRAYRVLLRDPDEIRQLSVRQALERVDRMLARAENRLSCY